MRIQKVGVIGAGVMGHGIAALCASAGLPVVLLDIPGSDDPKSPDRSAPARNGLAKALKNKPAAFMDADRTALVTTGNTADHLNLLADCDWIVEVIIEQPKPKQELFARLEQIAPNAIITSNTSGIPMSVLLKGRSEKFRRHFCGTHFFNPPRYMHLLEIIPTPETAAEALDAVQHFQQRILGKGIVIAKDVPGFVANRLGVHGMVIAGRLMMEFDLTISEVDTLTGALIARAKTATFRTGDLSGIDVLVHVSDGLSQATGEDLKLAPWIHELVKSGRLGDKTKQGFYNKQGKDILTLNWKTLEYENQGRFTSPKIEELLQLPSAARVLAARKLRGKHGDFLHKLLVEQMHYCLTLTPQLAYDIAAVDRAMEWGYGWELGPFKVMDAVGLSWLRGECEKAGKSEPELLKIAGSAFYKTMKKGVMIPSLSTLDPNASTLDSERSAPKLSTRDSRPSTAGSAPSTAVRIAVPPIPGQLLLASCPVRAFNPEARVRDLGGGVLCLEFSGKMNTLGPGVLEMLATTIERIDNGKYAGLVIGNDDPRTFSAGANLSAVAGAAAAGEWKEIEHRIRAFQDAVMSVRRAPFPVVAAPFGLTLGGGVEFSLHADRVQAHAELYMGLVEVGVGIIPSGCGTKELLFRFTEALKPYEEADPFEAARRAFKLIALAQMSGSALEARKMGFLRPVADRITFNRDTLISDAKQRVLDLAPDYVPPPMKTIRVLGKETLGNLDYALFSFKEAGQASDHDVRLGHEVAYVLAGGDGPPRDVTEQDIIDLEREATLKLLGTAETQARIKQMLETGKPLRN
ncbi:MAG TPA: 3-hydroxyacyl-CoA dehydrogenase/enoyl-CoA hydratase family protein [Gemmatimonadaceae bacterium]|nr:3-hydroxyacyl-CoA dehydrogenase/enoyl-CoA hydratase family protein [Gemmatimonadaceae bacterium]